MTDKKGKPDEVELKEYADGWITERKGTDVPMFLKIANIVIIGGCVVYFILYAQGETTHSTRGPLVNLFNMASQCPPTIAYLGAGLAVVYGVLVVLFAFRKFHED